MDIRSLIETLEQKQSYIAPTESKLVFNQPDRLFLSSENGIRSSTSANNTAFNNHSFNNFTIALQRPCINVKSIQLVSANIPTTSGLSFNDYELVFYYYRLRVQRNFDDTRDIILEEPSLDNLYVVRLLPSYYKPELVPNYHLYGFNKTFNSYQELADELQKACANDLAVTNGSTDMPFLANDISITYNEQFNKFQMTGNNINNIVIPLVTWNGAAQYYTNDIVWYNGDYYIANQDNIATFPTNPASWNLYCLGMDTKTKEWNTYLVAGYNDPNVQLLMKVNYSYTFPTWNSTTRYMARSRVSYDNGTFVATYKALIDNTNVNPTNMFVWQAVGDSPDGGLGINSFSRIFDFNNEGTYGSTNLVGIPPQPFLANKIMNLKLGFTWDGVYKWLMEADGIVYQDETAEPQLYNRLRPVPQYAFLPPEGFGLGVMPPIGNPFTATTYLADGYCNLVLSSILYIYTSIIGASTLDTQRNTNLLAIVPLNCSTLGITFTNNFLDNPLTKVNSDISNIYIEFRNEHGELVNLGNNGACSFALKLEY